MCVYIYIEREIESVCVRERERERERESERERERDDCAMEFEARKREPTVIGLLAPWLEAAQHGVLWGVTEV